jgi:hypothetical protein
MSRASKLTLLGTSLGTVGIVFAVHFQQKFEREVRRSYTPDSPYDTPQTSCSCEANSDLSGHARRRCPRYGTAENQARKTIGLRFAKAIGGRVQAGADSARLNSSSREKSSKSIAPRRTSRTKCIVTIHSSQNHKIPWSQFKFGCINAFHCFYYPDPDDILTLDMNPLSTLQSVIRLRWQASYVCQGHHSRLVLIYLLFLPLLSFQFFVPSIFNELKLRIGW